MHTALSEKGIFKEDFDAHLGAFVTTTLTEKEICQQGTVKGVPFSLTIRLARWTGRTTPSQIVTLSRLFWQVYPKMYARFGQAGGSPLAITLDIENRGYGIAWCAGSLLHLHDGWLEKCPEDFDCITHELAHAIQNGWDGAFLEYDSFIERFADACRYLYAFEDGLYNDKHWTMQTILGEPTRADSVRFLVWLDYVYSTKEHDLLLNYFKVCKKGEYPASRWKEAWAEIFCGSPLEGTDIEEVYERFTKSDFATLETGRRSGVSPLLSRYDVRRYTKNLPDEG